MNDLSVQKRKLRRLLLEKRAALTEAERQEYGRCIAERILAEPAFQKAKTIFSFMPMDEEVQLQSLFTDSAASGKRFGFPVCFSKGRMEVYEPADRDHMERDRFGILAPNPERDRLLAPEELDFVIVPLLGFDRELYRIGYGGGFYDRYLRRLRPGTPFAGVAYSLQDCRHIPRESFDLALPVILTEKERISAQAI